MNICKEFQDCLAGKGPSENPAHGKSLPFDKGQYKGCSVLLVSPKVDIVMSRDMFAKLGNKGLKKMGMTVGRFI